MKTLLLIIVTFCYSNLYAQTAIEIMKKNNMEMESNSQIVDLVMKLENAKGKVRERKLEWKTAKNAANNSMSLIRFTYPADIAGSGFLSIENNEDSEDMWLYLPALKKIRQISSGEKSKSFMGSDFSYSDINDEILEDFDYKLLGEISFEGVDCYKIEATPISSKTRKESGYSKRIIYIQTNNSMIKKVDYYSIEGTLFKELSAKKINKIEGSDKKRAHILIMKNLKKNTKTTLLFNNFKLNIRIDDNIFTKRNLSDWN